MDTLRQSLNIVMHIPFYFLILVSFLSFGLRRALALEEIPTHVGSRFLVLNDCDDDDNLKTAPYGDKVYIIDSRGEMVRIVADGLRITDRCGGLSVSEDGRYFVVCDKGTNELAVYDTGIGRKIWSLVGLFDSATFANSQVFAANADGIYAIDNTGTIVKHVRNFVFDFAIDPSLGSLWISGLKVKKYNLDLEAILNVNRINGVDGPIFIEMNPDGSIWLAQRDPDERYGSHNLLFKISPEGRILQTVPLKFCPGCIRVNPKDGSVWVTGKGYRDLSKIGDDWPETIEELYNITGMENCTQKFDSEGRRLLRLYEGGNSLVIDPYDDSVWIVDKESITHFSSTGERLGTRTGDCDGRKWLALIPEGRKSK